MISVLKLNLYFNIHFENSYSESLILPLNGGQPIFGGTLACPVKLKFNNLVIIKWPGTL